VKVAVTTSGLTTLHGDIVVDSTAAVGTGIIDFSGATGGIVLATNITLNVDGSLGGTGGEDILTGPPWRALTPAGHGLTIISADGSGGAGIGALLGQIGTAANPLAFLTLTHPFNFFTSLKVLSGNIFTDNNVGTGAVAIGGGTGLIRLDNTITINTDA